MIKIYQNHPQYPYLIKLIIHHIIPSAVCHGLTRGRYYQQITNESKLMHHRDRDLDRQNESQTSSPTRNRRYHIERNSQGEEEVVLPYWEEGSSANHHMQEEIRLLKMKNTHFQEHMDRMKLQYEELRKTIEAMDDNQRELMRKNSEFTHRLNSTITRIQEAKSEVETLKYENEDLKNDLKSAAIREEDYKRRISRLREEEAMLNTKLTNLEEEQKILTISAAEKNKHLEKLKSYQIKVATMVNEIELERAQVQSLQAVISRLRAEEDQKLRGYKQLKEEQREKERNIRTFQEQVEELQEKLEVLKQRNEKLEERNDKLNTKVKKCKATIEDLENQNRKLKEDREEYQNKKNQVMVIDRVESVILTENASPSKEQQQHESCPAINLNGHKDEQEQGENDEGKSDKDPNYQQIIHQLQLELNELTNQNISLKKQLQKCTKNVVNQSLNLKDQQIRDMKLLIEQKLVAIQQLQKNIKNKNQQIQSLQHAVTLSKKTVEDLQISINKQKERQEAEDKNNSETKPHEKLQVNIEGCSISELEAEYKRELQALLRLIAFKQGAPNVAEIQRKVRKEEQKKLDKLIGEYQCLQKQLFALQQQIVGGRLTAERDLITFRNAEEEKILYFQAIKKWEIAYEELHAIYQAKLSSKDQEITLLNLRLANNR